MLTFPLQSISIEEAKEKQFRLVDEICKVFPGSEFLKSRGFRGYRFDKQTSTNRKSRKSSSSLL